MTDQPKTEAPMPDVPPRLYVSGERWADQVRRILVRELGDLYIPEEVERLTADLTAWAVEAGDARYRQGYAAGASDAAAGR